MLWLRAHVRDPAVVRSTLSRYHITSLHHLAISTRPQVRVLWSPWPGGPSYEVATLFEGEFMGQLGDKEGEVRDTEPRYTEPRPCAHRPCALVPACGCSTHPMPFARGMLTPPPNLSSPPPPSV